MGWTETQDCPSLIGELSSFLIERHGLSHMRALVFPMAGFPRDHGELDDKKMRGSGLSPGPSTKRWSK
jgi:hypothetical protein